MDVDVNTITDMAEALRATVKDLEGSLDAECQRWARALGKVQHEMERYVEKETGINVTAS